MEEQGKQKKKNKKPLSSSFCPINNLDDGCLMHIFSFLSPIPDRYNTALVCHRWCYLACHPRLWLRVEQSAKDLSEPGVFPSIEKAVSAARPGDTILIAAGGRHLASNIQINKPLCLIGGGQLPDETTLLCSRGSDRCVEIYFFSTSYCWMVLRIYACIIGMAFILLSDALMHIRPSLKHAQLLVYFFLLSLPGLCQRILLSNSLECTPQNDTILSHKIWYILFNSLCSALEFISTCKLANLTVKAELGCCLLHRSGRLTIDSCILQCEASPLDYLSCPIISTAGGDEVVSSAVKTKGNRVSVSQTRIEGGAKAVRTSGDLTLQQVRVIYARTFVYFWFDVDSQ
ncbi:hypothetical protein POTOM_000202 [Populus tomentosa]|uniref:F-box domain-containing protein n=1 Tax=Populus tomentosa TaxID=118781 RepID=A0A8X8D869_POPTO|nr:hypothetical protein POTOM_000202 [Populus tomentosa]